MQKDNLKKWHQPKLIVISQGKPEENVLAACKSHANPGGVSPTVSKSNCNEVTGGCAACQSNGGGGS